MGMKHLHKGKESYPTRVWNVGCGPNGQIISCPPSMGGARNDKTLAHYDPLMQALKLNTRYGHLKFELYVKGGGMEWSMAHMVSLTMATTIGGPASFLSQYPQTLPSCDGPSVPSQYVRYQSVSTGQSRRGSGV